MLKEPRWRRCWHLMEWGVFWCSSGATLKAWRAWVWVSGTPKLIQVKFWISKGAGVAGHTDSETPFISHVWWVNKARLSITMDGWIEEWMEFNFGADMTFWAGRLESLKQQSPLSTYNKCNNTMLIALLSYSLAWGWWGDGHQCNFKHTNKQQGQNPIQCRGWCNTLLRCRRFQPSSSLSKGTDKEKWHGCHLCSPQWSHAWWLLLVGAAKA